MKKQHLLGCCIAVAASGSINACRNVVLNNTHTTYKVVECTEQTKWLKKKILLPKNLEKNEHIAHTIEPGEKVGFGGHYVPEFIIYKEVQLQQDGQKDTGEPTKRWRPILVVKQTRCGPRGREVKMLLMTDLLKRQLPGDYQDVYKFTLKAEPDEIAEESVHAEELTQNKNKYQELLNIIENMKQKVLELMSEQLDLQAQCRHKDESELEKPHEEDDESEGGDCPLCRAA